MDGGHDVQEVATHAHVFLEDFPGRMRDFLAFRDDLADRRIGQVSAERLMRCDAQVPLRGDKVVDAGGQQVRRCRKLPALPAAFQASRVEVGLAAVVGRVLDFLAVAHRGCSGRSMGARRLSARRESVDGPAARFVTRGVPPIDVLAGTALDLVFLVAFLFSSSVHGARFRFLLVRAYRVAGRPVSPVTHCYLGLRRRR